MDESANPISVTMSFNTGSQSVTQWIAERTGRIFGFRITPTTPEDLVDATVLSISKDEPLIIAGQNMHGLYVSMTDDAFQALHELPQSLIHVDGFPIIYIAWLHGLRKTRMAHRTGVHDWLPNYVREASNKQWRVFCLGSNAEVNARAVNKLSAIGPNAVIAGRDGYFDALNDSVENQKVIDEIVEFNADILLVGMGMGRQEQWILNNKDKLNCPCIIVVGACLEYMAGEMKMSPRWFGPFGLEAAWRLVTHPKRYAHRYLVEPWLLLGLLIKSGRLFGQKR